MLTKNEQAKKLKEAKKTTGVSVNTLIRLCIERSLADVVNAIIKK
jgi:hypothetical protein